MSRSVPAADVRNEMSTTLYVSDAVSDSCWRTFDCARRTGCLQPCSLSTVPWYGMVDDNIDICVSFWVSADGRHSTAVVDSFNEPMTSVSNEKWGNSQYCSGRSFHPHPGQWRNTASMCLHGMPNRSQSGSCTLASICTSVGLLLYFRRPGTVPFPQLNVTYRVLFVVSLRSHTLMDK